MDEPNTKRSWKLTLCRKHESNVYCCGIIEIVSPVEQNNISNLARAYLTHKHIINLHMCAYLVKAELSNLAQAYLTHKHIINLHINLCAYLVKTEFQAV